MTSITLFCRACGSYDVEMFGYDDGEVELWLCNQCHEVQSRQELEEEWDSSFDLESEDEE